MKNSYNKLNKKGRFWFWWFASCNLAILVFLVIMSFLTYTIFKQQKQLEQQQSTITKLKRENESNTASILRLVAYLENVGGWYYGRQNTLRGARNSLTIWKQFKVARSKDCKPNRFQRSGHGYTWWTGYTFIYKLFRNAFRNDESIPWRARQGETDLATYQLAPLFFFGWIWKTYQQLQTARKSLLT